MICTLYYGCSSLHMDSVILLLLTSPVPICMGYSASNCVSQSFIEAVDHSVIVPIHKIVMFFNLSQIVTPIDLLKCCWNLATASSTGSKILRSSFLKHLLLWTTG